MKDVRLGIGILLCLGSVALLLGCGEKHVAQPTAIGTGGSRDHSDYDAPKEILSDELIYVQTEFFRDSDLFYNDSRNYRFRMEQSGKGGFLISESTGEKLQCETDASFAGKVQQVIREHNLVQYNGIDKQTFGISPEYGPYRFEARYASGETLTFSMNGSPDEAWTGAILDLFAEELGSHGIVDLLPPRETSPISRFSMEYAYDDIRYAYGEILVPITEAEQARSFEDVATNGRNKDECAKMVYADPWDRSGKTNLSDDRRVEVSEAYYQGLQAIVDDTDLRKLQNGQIFPFDFDYETTPQYYEFYIEYENGNCMSGFSDDPTECERFKPIAEQFSAYFEDYLNQN